MTDQAYENTDTHLWPLVSEEPFPARIFATKQGGIGICVGGLCIVKPLKEWHALACEGQDTLDPTTRGDLIAEKMRAHYEANRETWWQRRKRRIGLADNLMLGLLNIVDAERRDAKRQSVSHQTISIRHKTETY